LIVFFGLIAGTFLFLVGVAGIVACFGHWHASRGSVANARHQNSFIGERQRDDGLFGKCCNFRGTRDTSTTFLPREAQTRLITSEKKMSTGRPLAVVTGASTGIGYELAKCCAKNGFDLLIAADEPRIQEAAKSLKVGETSVEAVQTDLSTIEGVDKLYAKIAGRPVAALLANAGRGLGKGFLDQDFQEARLVVDTNITGTIYLIHKVGNDMRRIGEGKILLTGSIAGFLPGAFQAVYNGTKAFIDSFAAALREEIKDSGVSVSCLMPGATETEFFKRADLMDTKIGQEKKDDPADVAELGFEAMMKGTDHVIFGAKNKMQVAAASVLPSSTMAEQHRKQAEPGSASKH
jgi:short-subunit dehydrogenase